jgi:hypothetical protein
MKQAITFWTLRFSRFDVKRERLASIAARDGRSKLRRWWTGFRARLAIAKIYYEIALRPGNTFAAHTQQHFEQYQALIRNTIPCSLIISTWPEFEDDVGDRRWWRPMVEFAVFPLPP